MAADNTPKLYPPKRRKPPVRRPLSKEHIARLVSYRELIAAGYYNTEEVIEDLSVSLTKAVCVFI